MHSDSSKPHCTFHEFEKEDPGFGEGWEKKKNLLVSYDWDKAIFEPDFWRLLEISVCPQAEGLEHFLVMETFGPYAIKDIPVEYCKGFKFDGVGEATMVYSDAGSISMERWFELMTKILYPAIDFVICCYQKASDWKNMVRSMSYDPRKSPGILPRPLFGKHHDLLDWYMLCDESESFIWATMDFPGPLIIGIDRSLGRWPIEIKNMIAE